MGEEGTFSFDLSVEGVFVDGDVLSDGVLGITPDTACRSWNRYVLLVASSNAIATTATATMAQAPSRILFLGLVS